MRARGCPLLSEAFRSTTARSRPQRGPGRRAQDRAGRAVQPANDQQLVDEMALVRRTIVGRGRRQRRLRRGAARASPLFQVPPFVEIAARGRVVSGEPGGAAVRGAGAGVAKAPDWRLGVRAAAPALLQHRHAWSVPTAEQAKPCLPCHAQGRWRQASCRRAATRHAGGDRATRLTGLPRMVDSHVRER
jgi:hypothetical protein